MLKPPCKNCTDREVGCHSICEKYIAYDKERKQLSLERAKIKQVENDIFEITNVTRKRNQL